ncbi:hypothetical protein OsccyDRAFT_3641 [Leptolyngbyaceae cyanobacterium JSC-12]|nr:hypothetical protein OsccyDRAFT_3641 [Leptolyngbyaceae cyanobacterium JSC-12]
MKTHIETKQGKSGEQSASEQPEFDFELWARQVRPQLLASVQKRGVK